MTPVERAAALRARVYAMAMEMARRGEHPLPAIVAEKLGVSRNTVVRAYSRDDVPAAVFAATSTRCVRRRSGPGRTWTPDEDATLLELVGAGCSPQAAAAQLARPVSSVWNRAAKLGSPFPPRETMAAGDVARAAEMRASGVPMREIADRMGRSIRSVESVLHRHRQRLAQEAWEAEEDRLSALQIPSPEKIRAACAAIRRANDAATSRLPFYTGFLPVRMPRRGLLPLRRRP